MEDPWIVIRTGAKFSSASLFFSDDVIRLIWSLFVSQKKKQKKLSWVCRRNGTLLYCILLYRLQTFSPGRARVRPPKPRGRGSRGCHRAQAAGGAEQSRAGLLAAAGNGKRAVRRSGRRMLAYGRSNRTGFGAVKM